MMDQPTAAVLIVVIGAVVIFYAINRVNAGKNNERRIKHDEFMSALQPGHVERMATIAAGRDAAIATATKKEPSPTLEGQAARVGTDRARGVDDPDRAKAMAPARLSDGKPVSS